MLLRQLRMGERFHFLAGSHRQHGKGIQGFVTMPYSPEGGVGIVISRSAVWKDKLRKGRVLFWSGECRVEKI